MNNSCDRDMDCRIEDQTTDSTVHCADREDSGMPADLMPKMRDCGEPITYQTNCSLPPFQKVSEQSFSWGDLSGSDFADCINAAYSEMTRWRRNIFQVPSGESGKEFVRELSRLFQAYAERSSLESIAITAAMVLPVLVLQKPHKSSKAKDHVRCLDRRLKAWKAGDIDGLVRECRVIQTHLETNGSTIRNEESALRGFTRLMLLGNIRGALLVLSQTTSSRVLSLSSRFTDSDGAEKTVLDALKEKHQDASPPAEDAIVKRDENNLTEQAVSVLYLLGPSLMTANGVVACDAGQFAMVTG